MVMHREAAAVGKGRRALQFLVDVMLHPPLGVGGHRAVPEDLEVEHLVIDLEDREQRVRRQDGVDVDQQATDVFAPVADDIGGDDEFLEQADLETENVLVHGDAAHLVEQRAQRLVDPVEFDEDEIALGHCQRLQIAHRADLVELLLQALDGPLDTPPDPPHGRPGEYCRQRQQQGEGEQQLMAGVSQQAGVFLADFDRPQGDAGLDVGMALQATLIGNQRVDVARFLLAVEARRATGAQGLGKRRIDRRLGDLAVQVDDRLAAVDLYLHAAAGAGAGHPAQEVVGLLAAPALAHQLVH